MHMPVFMVMHICVCIFGIGVLCACLCASVCVPVCCPYGQSVCNVWYARVHDCACSHAFATYAQPISVRALALNIAKLEGLGKDTEQMERIELAALLHDIADWKSIVPHVIGLQMLLFRICVLDGYFAGDFVCLFTHWQV